MREMRFSVAGALKAAASLLLAVLLAGCVFVEVGVEPRPTPTPPQGTGLPAQAPTTGQQGEEAASPTPPAALTPTAVGEPSEAMAPGTDALIDCADVAPFAPGCLAQQRPPELGDRASFVGIVPDGPVMVMAWSPDGRLLAYAANNPEGWQGLVVRSLPDYRVVGRWQVPGPFDLAWTPDGEGLVFAFDRDDSASIGMARLGSHVWHDLLPGEKAILSTSRGKYLGEWLSGSTVALSQACGTGCVSLYALNVVSGDLQPLVNVPDAPAAPYGDHFATRYAVSPDGDWLAASDWGRGLPTVRVLPWPDPGEPVDPTAPLGGRYAEATGWIGDELLLYVFPEGEPDTWEDPRPSVYAWSARGGVRLIAEHAYAPSAAPSGDVLALVTQGRATEGRDGTLRVERDAPHLTLVSWPGLALIASHSLGGDPDAVAELWMVVDAPAPAWLDDQMVAMRNAAGQVLVMDERGRASVLLEATPALRGLTVRSAGGEMARGANGDIAMLVGEEIWVASLR